MRGRHDDRLLVKFVFFTFPQKEKSTDHENAVYRFLENTNEMFPIKKFPGMCFTDDALVPSNQAFKHAFLVNPSKRLEYSGASFKS